MVQEPFGKASANVQVISSLSGGGKSRLLAELWNLLQDSDIRAIYLVTFNNVSPLGEYDQMQDIDHACMSVAMRLLYQAVHFQEEPEQVRPFDKWLLEFPASRQRWYCNLLSAMTINQVLRRQIDRADNPALASMREPTYNYRQPIIGSPSRRLRGTGQR